MIRHSFFVSAIFEILIYLRQKYISWLQYLITSQVYYYFIYNNNISFQMILNIFSYMVGKQFFSQLGLLRLLILIYKMEL